MPNGLKVFIVGSPRSGTSITYYAMREVMKLPGLGESHVLPIFQRLVHEFYEYARRFAGQTEIMASFLDTRTLKLGFAEHLQNLYKRVYPSGNWVDKTPGGEAVRGIPLILEVFPEAHVIIARRTGIETVMSIRKKFSVPFEEACNIWTLAARETVRMRELGLRLLEVDQFDMTNKPVETGRRLATFLGRPDSADALAEYFANERTDQLSKHDWTKRVTLDDAPWDDAEKEVFLAICGPMMEVFGYPT
jgi:hypothetical protein